MKKSGQNHTNPNFKGRLLIAASSVSTGGDGLPVLATDHLVDVKRVGFAADAVLQFQLTANQNPLLLLQLDQSLLQSERM